MNNIEKAIALLRENIETVPPHGCQRDEVLALLLDYECWGCHPIHAVGVILASDLPREDHTDGC